jgi:hypothetical protein
LVILFSLLLGSGLVGDCQGFVWDRTDIGEAVDNTALAWNSFFSGYGDSNGWQPSTTVYYYGGDSAKSGHVYGVGSYSYVETSVTGPGDLKFWWKISASVADYLSFYDQGSSRAVISGNTGWQQIVLHVDSGSHLLRWSYKKTGSIVDNLDAGFLDKVEWTSAIYSATIWGWDYINGWQIPVPISKDGVATGYYTPHTFTGLTGTHTFTVPSKNSVGHYFSDWSTDWTDETIIVSAGGTYTARYRAGYSATIWSWCAVEGWPSVPIYKNGVYSGYYTPHTFSGLTGTHTFRVPDTHTTGHAFYEWSTGSTSTTLSVTSAGVYTARYKLGTSGTLTVTSPNGGEVWMPGTTHTITWKPGSNTGYPVSIKLLKAGVVVGTMTSSTPNDGSFSWTISSSRAPGTDYRVLIHFTGYSIGDTSDGYFTIGSGGGGGGTITVTSPNGGESWAHGTTHLVTWTWTGSPGANVKIELLKAGASVGTAVASTPNDGSFSWTISSTRPAGTDYKIRVSSTTTSATDTSNNNFNIT